MISSISTLCLEIRLLLSAPDPEWSKLEDFFQAIGNLIVLNCP